MPLLHRHRHGPLPPQVPPPVHLHGPLRTAAELAQADAPSSTTRPTSSLDAAYENQLRQQALPSARVTVGLVLVVAFIPGQWWIGTRILLCLFLSATGLWILSFRSHSLLLDYASLSPPFALSTAPDVSVHSPPPHTNPQAGGGETDRGGETAEWLNGILSPLWPIIDRQLLVAVVDLVEDAMKAESPGVVQSVRLTDLSPGTHPIRLLSFRVLPSCPSQPFHSFRSSHPSSSPSRSSPLSSSSSNTRSPRKGETSSAIETTSAFNDPSRPEPSPWAADPEDQGHARVAGACQGGVAPSPAAGGGGRSRRGVAEGNDEQEGGTAFPAFKGPLTSPSDDDDDLSMGMGRGERGNTAPPGKAPLPAAEGTSADAEEGRPRGSQGEEKGAVPGPFVELEVEFGYRRAVHVGRDTKEQGGGGEGGLEEVQEEEEGKKKEEEEKGVTPEEATENIHFVVYLGLGVKKILTVPVPVLISVTHLRGTVHLRLQLVPEPPFVKTVGFGFKGMPEVGIAAHPLKSPLDIMTLPLLRSFILSSVRSVMSGFVLPRHYAVDLRKIMLGGDVAMKTRTTGLLVLLLHRAHSLPASDPSLRPFSAPHLPGISPEGQKTKREKRKREGGRGKSDPFVEVGWEGLGKALYKTRIIPSTLNPVWEEMCFVRVPQEPIEDRAKIRLTVKDHDRFNPDDALGYVDLPIATLAAHPGQWEKNRTAKLRGMKDEEGGGPLSRERGEIEFSAAFFPLSEKLPEAVNEREEKEKRDPLMDATIEERARESEEEHEKKKKERLSRLDDLLNNHHPTPPSHPTGILSFQIHQIADLSLPLKSPGPIKAAAKSAFKPGGTSGIRKADVPSSYVQVFVEEEMVYRTRLKPFSNAPYFNAGAEALLRDWQHGSISFAVMDYRDRDHDVLAGYLQLDLGEVLKDKSQVTKWYPLVGGEGSGRLRASVMFKPLAMHIPRGLREWSVGTLDVLEAKVEGVQAGLSAKLAFRIEEGGKGETETAAATATGPDTRSTLTLVLDENPLHLPVLSRLSPVAITLVEHHGVMKDRKVAYGMFWMNDIVRGEAREIRVEMSGERPLRVPNPHELPTLDTRQPSSNPSPSSAADKPTVPRLSVPTPPHRRTKDTSAPSAPSSSSSSSSFPPKGSMTLTLKLRWHPGISPHHSDLVLSASSAARASYQLYLHKADHEAAVRREKREARKFEAAGAGEGGAEDKVLEKEPWESSEDEDEGKGGIGKPEIVPVGGGKRRRKGGTLRWLGHSAKVATRRFANSRHHHLEDPEPETELQSAL